MSKAPLAVRLDGQTDEERVSAQTHAVVPETEPIEPEPVAVLPPERSGLGWGSLFVAGLGGFLTLSFGIWVQGTVSDLMARNPALGLAALVLAGVAALALLVMVGRTLRDILRERRTEAMRAQAADLLLAGGTLDAAKTLAESLAGLYASRAETAKGRAALAEALPQLFAPRDVLAVAERSLLAALDARAQAEIAQAARRVSLVTAVSPRALIDIGFVLIACARLLRRIAAIYAGRPGTIGLLRLFRQVLGHLVVTGGVAAGDAVVQQVLGQGLAARLSAKLGEGVLNGLLTARIGLAALAVCRPLPFIEQPMPTLSDVAADLASFRGDRETG